MKVNFSDVLYLCSVNSEGLMYRTFDLGNDRIKITFRGFRSAGYKDKNGKNVYRTYNLQLIRKKASVAEHFTDKKPVLIRGEVIHQNYQDTNGNWKTQAYIDISDIEFISERTSGKLSKNSNNEILSKEAPF